VSAEKPTGNCRRGLTQSLSQPRDALVKAAPIIEGFERGKIFTQAGILRGDPLEHGVTAVAQYRLDCDQRPRLPFADHRQVKDIARRESSAAVPDLLGHDLCRGVHQDVATEQVLDDRSVMGERTGGDEVDLPSAKRSFREAASST
jgi:hypothetical protein